ncbi:MAG: ABC transporter ATP-binding protein [Clostridia bacterium]|nr:ABC transporter ATP-binding protein [Clostridia bacterium]
MGVKVRDLNFNYADRKVLRDLSFDIPAGCLASVLGPNGVGKSTLFRCMLGLLKNFSGEVLIDGESVKSMSVGALARKIAYIPQSNYPSFNYSVLEMVLMGTTARTGMFLSPGKKEVRTALEAIEKLGLKGFADRDYFRISGGERQLVLIARAMAQRSPVLVLDEPTASLDYGNQLTVMSHLKALAKEGYTVIQSTHNPEQAYLFSDVILAMKDGQIIANGKPKDIIDRELIEALYGVKTQVESLRGDRVRVCVPCEIL